MATPEAVPAPAILKAHEQDAVIQERLAIPERSLKMLASKMNAIAKASDAGQTSQAITAFALELEAFMLNITRLEAVAGQTTEKEVAEYESRAHTLQEDCRQTETSIAALKRELVDVRQDRQNKLAYDELANEISKFGTREELETSLAGLHESIDMLHSESAKYDEIMQSSRERFETIAAQLESLRTDVGHEVGERERRAVERGREDGDVGDDGAGGEAGDTHRDGDGKENGEEVHRHKSSSLNPTAAAFRPSSRAERSRDSSPGAGSRRTSKRARTSRRNSVQPNDDEDDDVKKSARVDHEDGMMSEVDEEEEEGAA
jgi:hypothetical protein